MNSPVEIPHQRGKQIDTVLSVLEATAVRIGLYQASIGFIGSERHPREPRSSVFNVAVEQTFQSVSEVLHSIGGLPMAYEDERTDMSVVLSAFIINHYNPSSERWQIIGTANHRPPVEGLPVVHLECGTEELRANYMNFQHVIAERPQLRSREP